jgi:hypothetical protein
VIEQGCGRPSGVSAHLLDPFAHETRSHHAMSQQIGGYPPATTAGSPAGQPTTQVARDEATEVGRTAADAGRQVAGTAAEQAANVAQEVKTQARDLVGEARGQVQDQARAGQQKAADGIRALSQELREMADGSQQSGTVSEVARQAAERADRLADWLGRREPGDLVEEVRSFARRRPGAFLLGAAVAGVVVGRLTRGAVDSARADSGSAPQHLAAAPTYRTPAVPPSPYPAGLDVPPPVPGMPLGTPTPQGQAVPPHLPPSPAAPLPPAAPHVPGAPVDPLDRPTGALGEYVDDLDRPAGERGSSADPLSDPLDDPYRTGRGDFR